MLYSISVMARPKKITKPTKSTSSSKTKKATPKTKPPKLAKENFYQTLYRRLKLDESYMSLLLGAGVVVVLFVLLFIFIGSRNVVDRIENDITPTISPPLNSQGVRTYTIQEGEGLWDVAVKFYGDGFRWTDIAKANHMDPNELDYVDPGTKLIVP